MDSVQRLIALYTYAEANQIDVDWFCMRLAESMSMPIDADQCAIVIDPLRVCSIRDEAEKLAHELGHCETGGFYPEYAPLDERQRQEVRADRWSIKHVLPFERLREAVWAGRDTLYDLAEYFDLSESFVQKAIDYYTGPCGLNFQKNLPDDC